MKKEKGATRRKVRQFRCESFSRNLTIRIFQLSDVTMPRCRACQFATIQVTISAFVHLRILCNSQTFMWKVDEREESAAFDLPKVAFVSCSRFRYAQTT